LFLITDRVTGHTWDYYLQDHQAESIIACLRHLFCLLKASSTSSQR
jgi:hypothetical protein